MEQSALPILIISFILFTTLFGMIGIVIKQRKNRLKIRLHKFIPQEFEPVIENKNDRKKGLSKTKELLTAVGKHFEDSSFVQKWRQKLDQAAIPLKPGEFFVLRVVIAALAATIVFLMGYHWLFFVLSPILSYLIVGFYVSFKRERRLKRCSDQLAEALGTMANAMRAGFSFMQAMQLVGKEMPDPLGPEFLRTLQEINFGIKTEEALENLMNRLPNNDLDIVIKALLIQRSSGGNLAELLETMQETIHGRVRIMEELKSLTAQGRMSAWVITLLPIGLGIYLKVVNPEFFAPMLIHPLGWVLLGVGTALLLIGWFVIQKVVKVEV
ncbi:type II secretion system F family protein [Anaerobacillus sp. MEB173]|uniref:type II secretion system F family protein n=1 Tax=Anaerobacillus sp. MEB173 TaxID=3383345 RepID=UPI003F8E9674